MPLSTSAWRREFRRAFASCLTVGAAVLLAFGVGWSLAGAPADAGQVPQPAGTDRLGGIPATRQPSQPAGPAPRTRATPTRDAPTEAAPRRGPKPDRGRPHRRPRTTPPPSPTSSPTASPAPTAAPTPPPDRGGGRTAAPDRTRSR